MSVKLYWAIMLVGSWVVACAGGGGTSPEGVKHTVEISAEVWRGVSVTTGGIGVALLGGMVADEVQPRKVSCAPWPADRKVGPMRRPKTLSPGSGEIHGLGVGDLVPGKQLPASALSLEGKTKEEIFHDGFEGKEDEQAMMDGHIDQVGFRIIQFPKADLRVRMTLKDRVYGIYPGPTLRTAEGTGLGSSLKELEAAHGNVTLYHIPEPYMCAVKVPNYDNVTFLFTNCDWACGNEGAREVYIGGYEGEADELPWGDG
ncbi:MAG: hypothetical protein VYA34_13395 [Myxococcota bacterium]|nr:hypothetical protein [Myxococcota bacterium]